LAIILLLSFAISVIFWMNPVRNGTRHKFDSVFSKLSIFLFSLYVLFYKQNEWLDKIVYVLTLSIVITLFSLSSSCSRKKWCSQNHIIVHIFFHTIIILTLYEFLVFR
jgi:Ca2+/Na+ antiporter